MTAVVPVVVGRVRRPTVKGTVIIVLAAGVGLACGCNPEHDVPEHPTWAADARPIIAANCVSCHNSASDEEPSFDYATFADFMAAAANLDYLTSMGAGAIRRPALSSPMPPPPAAPLADWQVETLTRWFSDPM